LAHSGPLYIFALLCIVPLCLFVFFPSYAIFVFAMLSLSWVFSACSTELYIFAVLRFIPISLALLLCITQYFTHSAPISLALLLLSVLAFVSFHSARSAPIYPPAALFLCCFIVFWLSVFSPAHFGSLFSAVVVLAALVMLFLCFPAYFPHSARSAPIYPLRSLFSVLYLLSLTYSSYLIFLLEFISFFSAPAYSTRFAFLYAFIPALILGLLVL
jgi:hypothetical protein